MVDMSLCNGEGCERCESCVRYTLLPRADPLWQSYISSEECMSHDYVAFMYGE